MLGGGFSSVRPKATAGPMAPFEAPAFSPAVLGDDLLGLGSPAIVNLTMFAVAPPQVAGAGGDPITPASPLAQETTIILADDIDLKDRTYRFVYDPSRGILRRVFLIADTVRLTGAATIDLRAPLAGSRPERGGGDLTIFARRIVSSGGGTLRVITHGSDGPDERLASAQEVATFGKFVHQAGDGGDAGQVIVAHAMVLFDEIEQAGDRLAEIIRVEADGGLGGAAITGFPNRPRHEEPSVFTGGLIRRDLPPAPGDPGGAGALRIIADLSNGLPPGLLPDPRREPNFAHSNEEVVPLAAINLWQVRRLESIFVRALDAIQRQDPSALRGLLRSFAAAAAFDTLAEYQAALGGIKQQLIRLRNLFELPLLHRRIEVSPAAGVSRTLDVLAERSSVANRAAPTDILSLVRTEGSVVKLGLLVHDLQSPDVVRLIIDTEFTVDPWLAAEVAAKLKAAGERLEGPFEDWILTPEPPLPSQVLGIDLRVTGQFGQWTLTLDAAQGGIALQQLAGPSGLPVTLSWTYSKDDSIQGAKFIARLSLAKRVAHRLVRNRDKVRNAGQVPLTVDYLRAGSSFFALNPALSLAADEEKSLSGVHPAITDDIAPQLEIPSEAITYLLPPDLISALEQSADLPLVEGVRVTNLIPAFLEARQQAVRFAELRVIQAVTTQGITTERTATGIRLAPEGAQGSQVEVKFLQPAQQRTYRVEGVVHYGGGGHDAFQSPADPTPIIDITEDLLPPLA